MPNNSGKQKVEKKKTKLNNNETHMNQHTPPRMESIGLPGYNCANMLNMNGQIDQYQKYGTAIRNYSP